MTKQHWTAEQSSCFDAKANVWSVVYDPTPGGRKNDDGSTSYKLRFPAFFICDLISDPKSAAEEIASKLNYAEAHMVVELTENETA